MEGESERDGEKERGKYEERDGKSDIRRDG